MCASFLPAAAEAVGRSPPDRGDDPRRGREDRSHRGHSGPRENPEPAPEPGREMERPARQSRWQVSDLPFSRRAMSSLFGISSQSKNFEICLTVDLWSGGVIGGVPQQHIILWLFPVFSFHLCAAPSSSTVLKEYCHYYWFLWSASRFCSLGKVMMSAHMQGSLRKHSEEV